MARPCTLPEAISKIEGFGASPTNRPTRLNNPGDLNMADWLKGDPYNAVLETTQPGVTPRFAKFPNAAQGWLALQHLLLSDSYRNLTIEQAVNRYAPPVENATADYVSFVCKRVGCKSTDIVQDVMTRAV